MNLSTLLQALTKSYHFHVYHTLMANDGYRMETNCGPKRVSIWKSEAVVQWAFSWREEVVKRGFRHVDRFIRTRDGSPFVKVNQDYIVVQDMITGESLDMTHPRNWANIGKLTGLLFQTFAAITLQKPLETLVGKHDTVRFVDKGNIGTFKKEMVTKRESMFSYLVNRHWKSIEKRWKQSMILRQESESSSEKFVALQKLRLEQWMLQEPGILYFSSTEQNCTLGHQGLAELLTDLCLRDDASFVNVENFYHEFEKIYRPSLETEYHILYHFIHPQRYLDTIVKYLYHGYSDEECAEAWMDLCEQQDHLDRLYLWFAKRIDRRRQESVSL